MTVRAVFLWFLWLRASSSHDALPAACDLLQVRARRSCDYYYREYYEYYC